MAHLITTSIRLPPDLRERLEQAAHTLHRGKNWLIIKALEEFLGKLGQNALLEEAQRQSLLASQNEHEENEDWHRNNDTTGWT
jgi:predicted transcriptional regulator